jgi:Asp-tRNA(Asn)/Glu-tRNA(Gln) amidotransferase B subunit
MKWKGLVDTKFYKTLANFLNNDLQGQCKKHKIPIESCFTPEEFGSLIWLFHKEWYNRNEVREIIKRRVEERATI